MQIHKRKIINIIEWVLIFNWCLILTKSDAFYAPYLLIAFLGIAAKCKRDIQVKKQTFDKRGIQWLTEIIAVLLALTVLMANYKIFKASAENFLQNMLAVIRGIAVICGGWILFREILIASSQIQITCCEEKKKHKLGNWIWVILWAVLVLVNATVLISTFYPGILTVDSISQMTQISSGTYSNHHPYYHTQLIRIFILLGYKIFKDINKAVAVYSMISIAVMALTFVYVVATIDKITGNRKISIAVYLWYMIMPFHIMYSFTMWKDVFFGAVVTVFVVAVYRYLNNISNKTVNIIVIIISGFGMCLLRSNGWVAFLLSAILFAVIFRKKHLKLLMLFAAIIVCSYLLKHPVLQLLDVSQPDKIESLSIPAQQIARVIVDGGKLTENQKELLSQIIDIDKIQERYISWISNPVKDLVREKNNQDFINNNKSDFIKLYIQLGLKYPEKYFEGWIDETRGYWNGGYFYWRWAYGVSDNTLGITSTVKNSNAANVINGYFNWWENAPLLQIFLSIGLYVWLIILCAYKTIVNGNKEALFITIPFLCIIASLMIATPVYSEFRYAYSIFCAIPFILLIAFKPQNEKIIDK